MSIKLSPLSSNEDLLAKAQAHAQQSNHFAAKANESRTTLQYLMQKESRAEATVTFLVAFLGSVLAALSVWNEYLFSFAIYQVVFPAAPAICAIVIVLFGILASHFLRHYTALKELEWADFQARQSEKSAIELERLFARSVRRQLLTGWIFAIGVIIITMYVSHLRVTLEIAAGLRAMNFGFGVQDLMPTLCFVGELIFGVFLLYFFARIALRVNIIRNRNQLASNISECGHQTEVAYDYYQRINNESLNALPEDLYLAVYRHDHLNIGSEEYTLLQVSELRVIVKDAKGNPVPNAVVTGLTEGRQEVKVSATGTNGSAPLNWRDGSKALTCIYVNGIPYTGYFAARHTIELELEEPPSPTRRQIGFNVSHSTE